MLVPTLLAALVLMIAPAPAAAARPTKSACALACQAEIAQCATATRRPGRCGQQSIRRCRRLGLQSCAPPTISTSTTTLPEAVTTTTTTLPAGGELAGPWVFQGALVMDECGGALPSVTVPLSIEQTGSQIRMTFVNDMEVATGEVGAAGWSAGSHLCPTMSYCFEDEIAAAAGDPAAATFVARVVYDDGTSCTREWRGTVRRGY